MTIIFNGNAHIPFDINENEKAWKICDALNVLSYYFENRYIILGGDILTEDFEYTYDSWFFNKKKSKDAQYNVDTSYLVAKKYLEEYISMNGKSFFVVIVAEIGQ